MADTVMQAFDKFQFVGEFYWKEYATVRRGFFFVFSGAIFGIRWFDPYRRRDGSVLEGTICKQFVRSVKNGRSPNPVVCSSPSGRLRSVLSY